ncbi:CBS domain-containing protein [Pseudenhygromyxa sp. WMMC2535]|uniref:CBS domain-containing protein n=1 Tax=Pseudenhygromyxa sp. WMMC2535 TaxID=2712867 RepID=UPI0015574563|nr:CBS domain-containing protein [Pseudenhygromyxa sp. WMMC2535]
MQAREFMVEALIVVPDRSVRELAELLLREGSDGACVVENGKLIGVVTTMDLVFQEKKVHLPSFLSIMDFTIPLEPPDRLRSELDKIAGTKVRALMSGDPITVGPETSSDEIATKMVEEHITILPVVEGGRVLGMITKQALLQAVFKR